MCATATHVDTTSCHRVKQAIFFTRQRNNQGAIGMEELNRLDWPEEIPRTPLGERENIYGNHASLSQVAREIQGELEQMGVDPDTY